MYCKIRYQITVFFVGTALLLQSCVDSGTFDPPKEDCTENTDIPVTFAEVQKRYVDQTVRIQEDLTIVGYVTSSDSAENFYGTLHFQDSPNNPTAGFQIAVDLRDTHLFYPIGSKIFIRVKGLYLGKSKDVFELGGVFTSFGNTSVGRLPATQLDAHLLRSCEMADMVPTVVTIEELSNAQTSTLVTLTGIEVDSSELGKPFAIETEETKRLLTDCADNELYLLNSGYSEFWDEPLPEGNGSITGVLLREEETFYLAVRDLSDIRFSDTRCEDVVDTFSSRNVFISELADPDNNTGARFVELYNSGSESISLKGWTLGRYTNSNTEVGAVIDLSDLSIGAKGTLVISPDILEFEAVYGFVPDLGVGSNSPADSNGDDNLVLIDPFGELIDIYGVIGEDGSGTAHEFEDGRAVRNTWVTEGNPVFTPEEWTIYNDTGAEGTIEQPQNAPGDFTPGTRD
ncbi:DUF5689 domain-containing protein [Maribacter sp. 2-571]|uniref:DUF5689 domain-containing protein n=1 Tax=Maribacter sp. 2-571 TaxID=3417569 RepID=UPI003D3542E2